MDKDIMYSAHITDAGDLDNLLNTRDICVYIDALMTLKDEYLVILCAKENIADISEEVTNKIHSLGFNNLIIGKSEIYIGISDKSNVICDELLEMESSQPTFERKLDELSISFSHDKKAKITINEKWYSLIGSGLNFIVFDYRKMDIIDSSQFNPKEYKQVLCHRNLDFTEEFFDTHFFVLPKYKNNWREFFRKKYYSNRSINSVEIVNGIIEPLKTINGKSHGGVCDENFKFVAGHGNFSSGNADKNARYVSDSYIVRDSELDYCDETVIFGGIMYDHPGHLIIESIADRLWYIVKNPDSTTKIAVISSWGGCTGRFLKEFIDALGIPNERLIIVKKPTKFKSVIVPDSSERVHSWPCSCEFTKEYISFFEYMRTKVSPSNCKKIYLTKTKTNNGNIVGEKFFIDFYKNKGFTIINPEDYTIKEKVALMLGADEIVTPDGTSVLFSVFCKPTVKLTILSRTNNEMNSANFIVLEAAKIKEIYVVNVSSGFFHKHFVFGLSMMSVTEEFKEYVSSIYNEQVDISVEESLKNNLYDYIKIIPEYYSNPIIFNILKNQKMITMLQNISEVFLGKNFDTSNLDLSTNESNLQNQVKDLTKQKNTLTTQVSTLTEENKALKSTKSQNETEIAKLRNDQNKLNTELLDAHRQKDEADKKIIELYHQKDEVYQKLLETYRQKDEIANKLLDATNEKLTLITDISAKKSAD